MKKFWKWMKKKGFLNINNSAYLKFFKTENGEYEIASDCMLCYHGTIIPKQMLIGYMEEYIMEVIDKFEAGAIERRYNKLKESIEENA